MLLYIILNYLIVSVHSVLTFIFIALKDKSIMVKCKPRQAQKQLHYTANKISAIF